jgi:virulence-associated protein VagC
MAEGLNLYLPLSESVKKVELLYLDKDKITALDGHHWDDFFLNGLRVTEDFMNEKGSKNF